MFKREQFACAQNGSVSKHIYDVADCEGTPSKILQVNMSLPVNKIISCAECKGYFHYKSYRLPMNESDCANKASYGYKEHLVSWQCQSILDRYSQKLSCTDDSVYMRYWRANNECDGAPMLHVKVEDGCQEVDFEFFERRANYRSYQEVNFCGYALQRETQQKKKKTEL